MLSFTPTHIPSLVIHYHSQICTIIDYTHNNCTQRKAKHNTPLFLNLAGQKIPHNLQLHSFALHKNSEPIHTSTNHCTLQLSILHQQLLKYTAEHASIHSYTYTLIFTL